MVQKAGVLRGWRHVSLQLDDAVLVNGNILPDAPVDEAGNLRNHSYGGGVASRDARWPYPGTVNLPNLGHLKNDLKPGMDDELREQRYKDWKSAVAATLEVEDLKTSERTKATDHKKNWERPSKKQLKAFENIYQLDL